MSAFVVVKSFYFYEKWAFLYQELESRGILLPILT